MVILAGLHGLLFRLSGQSDIVIGVTTANRKHTEVEKLIGFFVDTHPIRVRVAPNDTFQSLIAHVRRVLLEAYANQDIPFERIVRELRPDRHINENPIFQVVFSWYNGPKADLDISGLHFNFSELHGGNAKFDLALLLSDAGERIVGKMEYNRDLFAEDTISQMAYCLVTLFEEAAAAPQKRLLDLPLQKSVDSDLPQFKNIDERGLSFDFS